MENAKTKIAYDQLKKETRDLDEARKEFDKQHQEQIFNHHIYENSRNALNQLKSSQKEFLIIVEQVQRNFNQMVNEFNL